MSKVKTVYHIEVDREKASEIWALLSDSFSFTVTKKQHSPDGRNTNIYIRLKEKV